MKVLNAKKTCVMLLLMSFTHPVFSQSEEFFGFLKRFATDSLFQYSRIHFPLEIITWNLENDEEVNINIKEDDYSYHPILNYNSECSDGFFFVSPDMPVDVNRMTMEIKGISDESEKYWFHLIEGKWYLIRYRNYDL